MKQKLRNTRWILLVLLAIACSWGVALARPHDKEPSHVYDIVIGNFKFQPDTVTVHVGDTIQWKNTDIFEHTVSAADKSFDSGLIQPGASWKLVVKKAGRFPYLCLPHPTMHGELVVEQKP